MSRIHHWPCTYSSLQSFRFRATFGLSSASTRDMLLPFARAKEIQHATQSGLSLSGRISLVALGLRNLEPHRLLWNRCLRRAEFCLRDHSRRAGLDIPRGSEWHL